MGYSSVSERTKLKRHGRREGSTGKTGDSKLRWDGKERECVDASGQEALNSATWFRTSDNPALIRLITVRHGSFGAVSG
jgi:hypothetical protein